MAVTEQPVSQHGAYRRHSFLFEQVKQGRHGVADTGKYVLSFIRIADEERLPGTLISEVLGTKSSSPSRVVRSTSAGMSYLDEIVAELLRALAGLIGRGCTSI